MKNRKQKQVSLKELSSVFGQYTSSAGESKNCKMQDGKDWNEWSNCKHSAPSAATMSADRVATGRDFDIIGNVNYGTDGTKK